MDQEKKGIVPTMIDAAAKATIETHPVRRNISVLMGAGGNIAVLKGRKIADRRRVYGVEGAS
jgi:hypothetical protein